jgi:hypothetical protein
MRTAMESSFLLMIDDLVQGRSESVMTAEVPAAKVSGDVVK